MLIRRARVEEEGAAFQGAKLCSLLALGSLEADWLVHNERVIKHDASYEPRIQDVHVQLLGSKGLTYRHR